MIYILLKCLLNAQSIKWNNFVITFDKMSYPLKFQGKVPIILA